MDYEIFEPDPNDEYYDQMCTAAYAMMFHSGRNYDSASNYEYCEPVDRSPVNIGG